MLKCWHRVAFKFFASLFVINKCVHFVKVVSLVHNNSNTSMTEMKPTNRLLTDRFNNKDQELTNLTNKRRIETHQWQTLHEFFSQYHHGLTDQSSSLHQLYNIINWQILFTWLWRWLPLRLSKRQSPTTVLFRTILTQTVTL